MILEIVGFIGAIILILIFLAEFKNIVVLGIIGSIILLLLGYVFLIEGVQVKTGEILDIEGSTFWEVDTNSTEEQLDNETKEITSFSTSTSSESTTHTLNYQYQDIAGEFNLLTDIMGLTFLLLSIYGMATYTMRLR